MDTTWSALIVDDDPGVRQSMRLCLEADNARVMGVATSAGALEAIDRGYFDVVFLDLWLQSESGLTVLPEIIRRQPGIGVVVITAFASFETAVEAMRLGAVDYLPKPFTPEQVRHAARRVVAASVLRRQISELQERLDESEGEATFDTRASHACATAKFGFWFFSKGDDGLAEAKLLDAGRDLLDRGRGDHARVLGVRHHPLERPDLDAQFTSIQTNPTF